MNGKYRLVINAYDSDGMLIERYDATDPATLQIDKIEELTGRRAHTIRIESRFEPEEPKNRP